MKIKLRTFKTKIGRFVFAGHDLPATKSLVLLPSLYNILQGDGEDNSIINYFMEKIGEAKMKSEKEGTKMDLASVFNNLTFADMLEIIRKLSANEKPDAFLLWLISYFQAIELKVSSLDGDEDVVENELVHENFDAVFTNTKDIAHVMMWLFKETFTTA